MSVAHRKVAPPIIYQNYLSKLFISVIPRADLILWFNHGSMTYAAMCSACALNHQ